MSRALSATDKTEWSHWLPLAMLTMGVAGRLYGAIVVTLHGWPGSWADYSTRQLLNSYLLTCQQYNASVCYVPELSYAVVILDTNRSISSKSVTSKLPCTLRCNCTNNTSTRLSNHMCIALNDCFAVPRLKNTSHRFLTATLLRFVRTTCGVLHCIAAPLRCHPSSCVFLHFVKRVLIYAACCSENDTTCRVAPKCSAPHLEWTNI